MLEEKYIVLEIKMKNKQKQAGFTLVELAIVMVIIGLLIGGILKGQELINNASVSSTAAKLKAFESAYMTFVDIYKQKPGDLLDATTRITGCNAGASCANGDGNGFIHYNNSIQTTGLDSAGLEHFQAMKHMALANLIGGVDGRASGNRSGDGYVTSDLAGHLYVGESLGNLRGAYSLNVTLPAGILVGQTPNINTWAANTGNGTTAMMIGRLDGKIDDGSPITGAMRMLGNPICFRGENFRENVDRKQCNFVYKIN
jgi:prepilin-type N-terminal cleavage/methylation domain-containing protein